MNPREMAAARFARASQMSQQVEQVVDTNSILDINDYDGFLEARSLQPPSTATNQPNHRSSSIQSTATHPTSRPISFASSTPSLRLGFGSLVDFGRPIPPANTRAANRRLTYLRRHLLAQPDHASEIMAAAATAGMVAARAARPVSATAASSMTAMSDYFDDESMERRRPALFHEYIGRFRQYSHHEQDEEEAEDETDRARRRGAHLNEADEEEMEEEQKMSDTVQPLPSRPSARLKSSSRDSAEHLPQTLSQLLLTNYDREQFRQQRENRPSNQKADSTTTTQTPTVTVPAPKSVTSSKPIDSMVDSDESELDDDDDALAPTIHRAPPMTFSVDDGRTMDIDGTDLREAGPTASAEYAAWSRELVNDDMDRRRDERQSVPVPANHAISIVEEDVSSTDDARASAPPIPESSAVDEAAEPPSPSSRPATLRSDFLSLMEQLFLFGYDGEWVDYVRIDSDETYDDLVERERTEQEEYFNSS